MDHEFDIDSPADMELLGGTADDDGTEHHEASEGATGAADTGSGDPSAGSGTENYGEQANDAPTGHDPETDPAPNKRDPVIPRARFDEVNAKLHSEREENERLRAELAARATPAAAAPTNTPAAVDIDALEDEYYECLMNGQKGRAKEIRATINAEIYARAEATSAEVAQRKVSEREARSSFDQVVAKTVDDYPFLDSNSPDAKPEAISEVIEWRDFYISKGDTPAAALQKAAARIAPQYVAAAPVPAVTKDDPPPADKRKQAAAATGAAVSAAQPPRVDAGVGNRAIPAGDAIIGNQEQWERASEADRLRFLQ